jgi:competence protein ComEC
MQSASAEGVGGAPAASAVGGGRALLARAPAEFIAERERWPLWLPVLIGIGVGIYFWLPSEPSSWIGPAGLAIAAATSLLVWQRDGLRLPAIAVCAAAMGFAAAQLQARWVAAPVLDHRLFATRLEGRVLAVEPRPEGARIIIAPDRIERLEPAGLPATVRVRLRRDDGGLEPGDRIALRASLLPPPAPAMPGAFDFQRRAFFDRIGAVGYAFGKPEVLPPLPGGGRSALRTAVEYVRNAVTQRIRAALPDREGGIAAALITGQTHAIPPEDAGAFRDAGLAHILVIAGLHMGMVAGIAFFALRAALALVPPLALRYPIKKWAAAGTLLLVFCYLLLSGATVSSRRAFAMIGLVLLAVLLDRLSVSARALALAATAILLMSPESAMGPSFQMSFAAVAALVAFYEALQPKLAEWHAHAGAFRRAWLYLLGITFTTVVTTVATMPYTIYHFNRFPLYSIVANALAVPITGFWIMPWAILSCLLMPFGLERMALVPMGRGIDAVIAIAHGVTSWPGAVLTVPSMPVAGLILLSAGGLWLCIWRRRWRWLGLAPIAIGYLTLAIDRPPDLLIAEESQLIAVRDAAGAYLPSTDHGAHIAEETWTKRADAALGPSWPATGATPDGRLRCDAAGCLYRAHGKTVALLRDGAALGEDCAQADLVVSPVAAHRACRHARVIDRLDTWLKGGHAVWLDADGIRIETIRQWQGDRLWSPRRGWRRSSEAPP